MAELNTNKCGLYECKEKGCQNYGSSNRLKYDCCTYKTDLRQSTSPLGYMLYEGKFENCGKCMHNNVFYRKQDVRLVDVESELSNRTRVGTRCPEFKYNPNCKRSRSCFSTFDKENPITPAPEICPIVHNNIPKMTTPGYVLPRHNFCGSV